MTVILMGLSVVLVLVVVSLTEQDNNATVPKLGISMILLFVLILAAGAHMATDTENAKDQPTACEAAE